VTYQATAVKVMIASPSDVPQERDLIRAVIHEWNDVNAEHRKFILMPIGWETHASPDTGDRPQAIINRQLKTCDLLVAAFFTRLGSPTGVADSGTVEEIEEHIKTGKTAMIYFSKLPVVLGSVDLQQYEKLLAFKEQMRTRGLTEEYDSLATFREKFSRQLAQKMIEKFPGGRQPSEETNRPPPATRLSTPPPSALPALSNDARTLLLAAAEDPNGAVMRLQTMDGMYVQTNEREFIEPNNAKSAARWRGAVAELHQVGLLEDRAGKGELYFVTDAGYRTAELVKLMQSSATI
jgi:hypothetical protein